MQTKTLTSFLFFFFLIPISLSAQVDFSSAVREADEALRKGEFEVAIKKYRAAQAYDPSKTLEIDREIDKVFLAIRRQRDEAVAAKKRAEEAESEAQRSASEMKRAFEALEKEKKATEEQRQNAEKQRKIAEEQTKIADEQRKIAEQNALLAQKNADEANFQKGEAQKTLKELEGATLEMVKLLNSEARINMYELKYEVALSKLKTAMLLRASPSLTFEGYIEVSFYFNEAGLCQRASGVLDTALSIMPEKYLDIKERLNLHDADCDHIRNAIWQIDSIHFDKLKKRYLPEMRLVEAGKFVIGCVSGDNNCNSYEFPNKLVKIDSFEIATTETTFWQWSLFCLYKNWNVFDYSANPRGDNPVQNVNWYDAVDYTKWLNVKYGDKYKKGIESKTIYLQGWRLPTEAEWEYAAKEGAFSSYSFIYSGSNSLEKVGWCKSNSTNTNIPYTNPVASKQCNKLGLYDMSGNVSEWCFDVLGEEFADENPIGKVGGVYSIVRGGSWNSSKNECRVSSIQAYQSKKSNGEIGFRVAKSL